MGKYMEIVAIGDSITEGYAFSNQESWVEHNPSSEMPGFKQRSM